MIKSINQLFVIDYINRGESINQLFVIDYINRGG